MTQPIIPVNTVAPLANVSLCMAAIQRAVERQPHLPGMVVFYGPSGYGKSTAAAYVRNKLDAVYVECKSSWTKKALLTEILLETGLQPAKTIYEMSNQINEYLADTGRALIVDEMDHLVEKKAVETIRDIYEGSQAPILLIGEEQLPAKLERWERFHGRILDWTGAQGVSLEDVAHLARLYCPELDIDEHLLIKIHTLAKGSARRVCVNLANVQEQAQRQGSGSISAHECPDRMLYTGKAPSRR